MGIKGSHDTKCELFGSFGFFVQFALGILSFMSLIVKRHCEYPKRSWRIWMLDVSKQGISSLLLHFLNLFLAVTISKQNDEDACVWYLVNILLDTSVGVIFEWMLVRLFEVVARRYQIEALISGCYYSRKTTEYDDLHIDYTIWVVQTTLWCIISSLMKLLVYLIMLSFPRFLEQMGNYMLESIQVYPRLELIVVMVIVPFIMNVLQFWLVDNILKESDESRIERLSRGKQKLLQVGPEYYHNEMQSHLHLHTNEIAGDG